MSEWQPIEAAPKDGRPVLLHGGEPEYDGGILSDWELIPVISARWEFDDGGDGWWRYCCYDGGFYGVWINPTHWMSLPEPPNPSP